MNTNAAKPDYSVAIRTLGTSGEEYAALVKSVEKQTIQPREILVVMALLTQ